MEEKVWKENEMAEEKEAEQERSMEEELHASAKSAESRLREAVVRIVPDESARERIIEGAMAGRHGRRLTPKIPAAALAACLLFFPPVFCKNGDDRG